MCDTLFIAGSKSDTGFPIFAKNSDRDPNEAHYVISYPSFTFPAGSRLKCTYIDIDQVEKTNAVILAKPFWIWGAEMGMNEHGLAIGNEAVFTKTKNKKTESLIGMDYLRLALERAKTALEGVKVITGLLEKYGQGGNCGFAHQFFYDNSYLLADQNEAWILETADKQWAAVRVTDFGSISNQLTIHDKWDMASADLVNFAVDLGWMKKGEKFDFAAVYSEFLFTKFSDAQRRRECTLSHLKDSSQKISIKMMMDSLRSHHKENFRPDTGITGADVCMHAGLGPIRVSQTTGTMVVDLTPKKLTAWVTGTSAPCTSLFKPVFPDCQIPNNNVFPTGKADKSSLWWRHEVFHRLVLNDYVNRMSGIDNERDEIEEEFIHGALQVVKGSKKDHQKFVDECFSKGDHLLEKWINSVRQMPVKHPMSFYHIMAWQGFNKQADLTL